MVEPSSPLFFILPPRRAGSAPILKLQRPGSGTAQQVCPRVSARTTPPLHPPLPPGQTPFPPFSLERVPGAKEPKLNDPIHPPPTHHQYVCSAHVAYLRISTSRSRAISDPPPCRNMRPIRQTCPPPHVRVAGPIRVRPFAPLFTGRQWPGKPGVSPAPTRTFAPPSRSPPLLRAQPRPPHLAGQSRCFVDEHADGARIRPARVRVVRAAPARAAVACARPWQASSRDHQR